MAGSAKYNIKHSSINTKAYRVVEGQSYNSTRQLVDSNDEQDVLEDMLDATKPPYLTGTEKFHYLLKSPFRYSPLEYGSRFGTEFENGIFYASIELNTALCEAAYRRFIFLLDSSAKLESKPVGYTSFSAQIKTNLCLNLTSVKWSKQRLDISNPLSYKTSHEISSTAREHGTEVIIFYCARTEKDHKNLAAISPNAISDTKLKHANFIHWDCYFDTKTVSFSNNNNKERISFKIEQFFVDGKFARVN